MGDGTKVMPSTLMAEVDTTLAVSGLLQNPYFASLTTGEMDQGKFLASQEQFYFAVDFFSRPMSALMMRIPGGQDRLGILENIVEEHGGFERNAFHEATFRQFLQSIGGSGERPDDLTKSPAVHAFNAAVLSACLNEDINTGIACLGIIEYAFADISALIGGAVVQRGWIKEDELVHYKLHAEIDKQHAADFFALITKDWQSGNSRAEIAQGLRLGVYVFNRLYQDLLI